MVAWYRVWHPLYYPFGWRVAMCGCGTTIPLVGGGIPLWLEGTYVWAWYYYPFGWWVCGWGDVSLVGGGIATAPLGWRVCVVCGTLWLVGLCEWGMPLWWVGGYPFDRRVCVG